MKCIYCGEQEATEKILNPNFDEEETYWDVCNNCKLIIKEQQNWSFGKILEMYENQSVKKLGNKIVTEAEENISQLEVDSGQKAFTATITKN